MATTYTAIATVEVGAGGAANIEFTSISGTYTDLVIKLSSRLTTTDGSFVIEFNNSSSSLSNRRLYTNASTVASFSGTNIIAYANRSDYTASSFDNTEIYVPNYASSNNKSVSIDNVTETNATTAQMALVAGLWSNSAAITSIKLIPGSGNFAQYSTATLYGIKNS